MKSDYPDFTSAQQTELGTLAAIPTTSEIVTLDTLEIVGPSEPKKRDIFHLHPDQRSKVLLEFKRSHPRVSADESVWWRMVTGSPGHNAAHAVLRDWELA